MLLGAGSAKVCELDGSLVASSWLLQVDSSTDVLFAPGAAGVEEPSGCALAAQDAFEQEPVHTSRKTLLSIAHTVRQQPWQHPFRGL